MQIFIKTLTGTSLTLNVNRNDSVLELKDEIQKRLGTEPES
jgi:hypothetical protein